MTSYFQRLSTTRFQPTENVSGAWNTAEQHIAPTIGLLAHLIEQDRDARRGDDLRLARIACEILGVLTLEPMEVAIRVIRPGRTIELVEAELTQSGRTAVMLRAWLLQRVDTAGFAGTAVEPLPAPSEVPPHDFGGRWPGRFVHTVEARRTQLGEGRAQCWLRSNTALVEGEQISPMGRMLGVVDVANGLTPPHPPEQLFFANVDLVASLMRDPVEGWTGLDIRVSLGADGTGITQTFLHDESGPVGTLSQTLTLRPR